MKQSAYVGLLAAASLCVATGCLKKKDSAAKSITNEKTNEELVERVLVMPPTSDEAASGMVSADGASIGRLVNDATAYCFASVMPSSDATALPEGTFVTSNFVRAADIWALINNTSGGGMDASARVAEAALGNVVAGNANGNGQAPTGLSLTETALLSAATVPVGVVLAAHSSLIKPDSIVINTAIDGTMDVLEHDVGQNVARIHRFRGGRQIGDLPTFSIDDVRVAKHFKPATGTVDIASVGAVTKKINVNRIFKDGKAMFNVTQFDVEAGKIISRPSRMLVDSLDDLNRLGVDAAKKASLEASLQTPRVLKPVFDAQQTANFKAAHNLAKTNPHMNPKAGAKAFGSWITRNSSIAAKRTARLANRAAMAAGQASSAGLHKASGLISRCTAGDVKTKLICAAGVTTVTVGAFFLGKLAWENRPGGKVNANATSASLSEGDLVELQAIANDHAADLSQGSQGTPDGLGTTASGSPTPTGEAFDVKLADDQFQRVKAGLIELGAKSDLPPCELSATPAL